MRSRGVSQTALRLAIGASRRQIVTQALVESVLLAIAGGVAGLLVAMGTARMLLALAFAGTTFLPIDTRPAPMVLAFASALALITGVVFGAMPAWFATRTDPIDALRGAGRSTGDRSSLTRTTLLVVQATVSVVLVAGSMMLARSLGNLERQDTGYEIDGRVLVALNRPPATYTAEKLDALNRDLEERLRRCRACRAPAWRSTTRSPTTGASWCWSRGIRRPGRTRRRARRGTASAPATCSTWA